MIITSAIFSTLQLLAMTAAIVTAVQVNRKHTLSKNFEWVISNHQFASDYSSPPLWPILIASFIVIVTIVYGTLTASDSNIFLIKTGVIFGALIILSPFYYLIEKKIGNQIPLREKRSASFEKRSIFHYVSRKLFWFANTTIIIALFSFVVLLLLDKISTGICITYVINCIILYGILYGSIILSVNEKTPHHTDTEIVTKEHLSDNYKIFSVRLMTISIIFISALMFIIAGFMWNGYILASSPFQETIFKLVGETKPLKPAMSLLQFDIIISFLSIPVFIYIARCKAIRDIVTIKLTGNR
ncbi:MAG: hypothetical protein GX639_00245 [Fibrobacter sp.]|nr:hypothetical protein [Fibrobacter sp.]